MEAAGPDPTYWLAQTKLRPPPLRADLVGRPGLLGSLRSALLSSRLTLVSAPAGYGKTTLLATLAKAAPDLPLAWLTLDEEDGDPTRFLAAVALALRLVLPGCGDTLLGLLGASPGPRPEPRHLASALVNDLLELAGPGAALVLDDLHLVSTPGVHSALDYFLERIPPCLHVAVATRHDPPLSLARLRARGELAEFRLANIRFTLEEAAELLNGRLRLGLGAEELARLHARMEGWPAGLRLVAGSLEQMPSPAERAAFLAGPAHLDRHVFDFLAAEVLDHQEPSLRRFLLETSILPELTAELCRAVTGREDAAAVLEELGRRGLFVMGANGPEGALRYHALFAEFLQSRLKREMPDRVAELHYRAAEATAVPGRAISHYLAAGRWEEAAVAVEQAGEAMLRGGLAGTVAGWLQGFPARVPAARPRLTLLRGLCSFQEGDLPAARADLESALHLFEEASDEAATGVCLSHLSICLYFLADLSGARAAVERGLALPLSPPARVQLLMIRFCLGVYRRAWAEMSADLDAALEEVRREPTLETVASLAFLLRLEAVSLPGAMERVERFLRMAVPLAGGGPSLLGVALQEVVAYSHLWRGRLEEAIDACDRTVADVQRLGGHPYLGVSAAGFGSLIYIARENWVPAGRLLDAALEQFKGATVAQTYMTSVLYILGRLRLGQGDLDGARQNFLRMRAAAGDPESAEAAPLRWKTQGLLAMAEARYAEAERAFREAAALEEKIPPARLFGEARALLARLALRRGRPEAALAELAPALEECERLEAPGPLLLEGQEVVPVLRLALKKGVHSALAEQLLLMLEPAIAHRSPVSLPETGQVLSARELEILRLVSAGASNLDIARQLHIGETTVKSHMSSILRKLSVSTRIQAAARARALGLL